GPVRLGGGGLERPGELDGPVRPFACRPQRRPLAVHARFVTGVLQHAQRIGEPQPAEPHDGFLDEVHIFFRNSCTSEYWRNFLSAWRKAGECTRRRPFTRGMPRSLCSSSWNMTK